MKLLKIQPSIRPDKKLMAHFLSDDGKTTTVHFGAKGYDDYTLKKDKEQRDRYRKRHQGDRINVPNTAGSLSYHILWGDSTSKTQNIRAFKKKFNI